MCVSACLVPVRRQSIPGVSRPDAALAPLPSPAAAHAGALLPSAAGREHSTARPAAAGAGTASPDLLHGRTMSIPTARRNVSCLLVQAAVKFEVRFKAQCGDLKNQQQSRMSSAWESKWMF